MVRKRNEQKKPHQQDTRTFVGALDFREDGNGELRKWIEPTC